VQANVSLKHAWPIAIRPQRVVYRHDNAYHQLDGRRHLRATLRGLIARRLPGIGVSHFIANEVGCPDVILNAYDAETFWLERAWDEREHDIIFVGRIAANKGVDVLLGALAALRGRGLRPSLTVVGAGPAEPSLRAMAENFGVAAQVRFAGILRGEALRREFNRHRIVAVPSTYREPFGLVALEGLACGCLPVVSVDGGLIEAIGPHGLTFPNGDTTALARRLQEALAFGRARPPLLDGIDGHLRRFRPEAVARRYIEVFERHVR